MKNQRVADPRFTMQQALRANQLETEAGLILLQVPCQGGVEQQHDISQAMALAMEAIAGYRVAALSAGRSELRPWLARRIREERKVVRELRRQLALLPIQQEMSQPTALNA